MQCKICQSETKELLVENLLYHECDNCEFIFLDEKHYPSDSQAKERYLLHNNSMENLGYVNMFEDFISKGILPFKNNQAKILDFGSGPVPVLAEILKRKEFDVDIFDLYFANNKISKKYDIITATEVFEHLKNPMKTIEEIKQYLNKDAILAVMTQFIPDDFTNWRYRRDITHFCFYSHKTMEFIANKFNFEIVFIDDKKICVFQTC